MGKTDFKITRSGNRYFISIEGYKISLGTDYDKAVVERDRRRNHFRGNVPCAVFVVEGCPRFVALGVSPSPGRKLGMMQLGSPHTLRVESAVWYANRERAELAAAAITLDLHSGRTPSCRIPGWFLRTGPVVRILSDFLTFGANSTPGQPMSEKIEKAQNSTARNS